MEDFFRTVIDNLWKDASHRPQWHVYIADFWPSAMDNRTLMPSKICYWLLCHLFCPHYICLVLDRVCLDPTFTLTRDMAKFHPYKTCEILIPWTSFQCWACLQVWSVPSTQTQKHFRIENCSSTNYQRPLNVYTEGLL
jgi:hypothetical protein